MYASNPYSSQSFVPSAPPLPEDSEEQRTLASSSPLLRPPAPGFGHSSVSTSSSSCSSALPPSSSGYSSFPGYGGNFPPGTYPEIVRSFEMVDKDRSGFIDEMELQAALSSHYQKFSIRTIRLLMFLFKNPGDSSSSKIGAVEFAALWSCLGHWQGIFERFDRDRSGEIDAMELRDALRSLGYAIPPSVLQLLISKYSDRSGNKGALNFDSFVECGMIIKGLTEKFKEKDSRYTGSATFTYDTFMSMIIPFLVS